MGLFSKLAFWRKEPELPGLGEFGKESGFKGPGGFGEAGMGPGKEPGFGEGAGAGFEQLGLGKEQELGIEPGLPELEPGYGGGPGTGQAPQQRWQRQPQQQWPQQQAYGAPIQPIQPSATETTMSKDIEILSSKLDALRASLDTINQRLANLERMASESQKRRW
ncbi:hypothetical protein KY361_05605 [Candidatus Woesearchaeota archaeon]|nr:hypothetical protein [Candidatus Woesearchaeota archaeon]